uniref:Uncharacterized protein n=1 Tax=Anguilla anguilla TaxID=7936 RepID=A0A0E9REW1_ANGAN
MLKPEPGASPVW